MFPARGFALQLQQRGIPLTWEGAVNQEGVYFSSEDERLLKLIAWHYGLSVLSALILLWQNDGRSLSRRVTPCLWAPRSSSGISELKHGCNLHGRQFWGVQHGGWGRRRCYTLAGDPTRLPLAAAGAGPAVPPANPRQASDPPHPVPATGVNYWGWYPWEA